MANICHELHQIISKYTKRFGYPYESSSVALDGVYIEFEKGELGHGIDRIVRVGTHRANHGLIKRLNEHFIKENKDRSIFRKHIGRALLNSQKDPFLENWEIDLTTKEARIKYLSQIDLKKKQEIEETVSQYIQNSISFAILPFTDNSDRQSFERKIIATVNQCKYCLPSRNWLGLHSPNNKIRESGLWNIKHLNDSALDEIDLNKIEGLLKTV